MGLSITVAHDFVCPWCWIGAIQVKKLKAKHDITIEWRGYELWPKDLPRPTIEPARAIPNRAPVPSRLDLMLRLESIEIPAVERPKDISTHEAHLAAEFAKSLGVGDAYILEVYSAFWELGENIEDIDVLMQIGSKVGLDPNALRDSILEEKYAENLVAFDAPAYESGVFNVPTFFIANEKFAEQPYEVLDQAVVKATQDL